MDESPILISQCPSAFNPPGVVIGLTRRNNYDLTTPTSRMLSIQHITYHLKTDA